MNVFEAFEVQAVFYDLIDIARACENLTHMEEKVGADDPLSKTAIDRVREAEALCKSHGFSSAYDICHTVLYELCGPGGRVESYSALKIQVKHVAEAFLSELRDRSFLYVRSSRKGFISNPLLLGVEVAKAFPSASRDIEDAGNCLAAECHTAAVFHLMRVVEVGLRALCVHLGLRKAKTRQGKYIPITYAEWGTMLDQLHPLVEQKLSKLKRGTAKQAAQEFYYPMLQDIRAVKDAWRNHVMHRHANYTAKQAEAILGHVKRLMSALSLKVRES